MTISTRKRNLSRILPLILIFTVLFAGVFNGDSFAGNTGSISGNNKKIEDLKKQADKIALDNIEREKKIQSLKNDLDRQQEFIQEVGKQIVEIEAQINAYIQLIDAKQEAMDLTEREIELKILEIENTQNRILQKERDIELLDEQNNDNIEQFGKIAAQMYMNSGSDAISLLTGSQSFYDVLVRTEMIRNIGEKNVEFMEELLDAISRQESMIEELVQDTINLEAEKDALNEQYQSFRDDKNKLDIERLEIVAEIEKQYGNLYQLTAQKEDLQKNVGNIKSQVNAASNQIDTISKKVAELEAANAAIEAAIKAANNPDQTDYTGDGFRYPLDSKWNWISCDYGCYCYTPPRPGPHTGVDIGNGGIGGANIYAMNSGTVVLAAYNGGYGNCVIIDHGGGIHTVCAHMSAITVSKGQQVEKGTVIGKVGSTGHSTGNHLHFEFRLNGSTVNPHNYVQFP